MAIVGEKYQTFALVFRPGPRMRGSSIICENSVLICLVFLKNYFLTHVDLSSLSLEPYKIKGSHHIFFLEELNFSEFIFLLHFISVSGLFGLSKATIKTN
jgi:hypothetical protein